MQKLKRIFAWIAIILLVSMYVMSLVFALMKSEHAASLFRASLGCTILVPVLLYLFLLVAKSVRPGKSPIVDCIIFDVGRVLLDFPWKEHAEEADVSPECKKILNEKIVTSPLWGEFDLGIRPYEEIIDEFASYAPEYDHEIREFLTTLDDCISPYWYTEDLLAGLKRKGYTLYYLSNWSEHSYNYLRGKGIMNFTRYMKGGIWSFKEHLAKPDPKIYEALIRRYGLTPSRCLFIDDNEKNVAAAKKAGIGAILFTEYNDLIEKLSSCRVNL